MRTETKSGLTNAVVASVEIPSEAVEIVVKTILEEIAESLRRLEPVYIRGFGTFGIRRRKARVGHNPRTLAKVDVPAKCIAHFKPCVELKRVVAQLPVS